jgi:hypothetical protein
MQVLLLFFCNHFLFPPSEIILKPLQFLIYYPLYKGSAKGWHKACSLLTAQINSINHDVHATGLTEDSLSGFDLDIGCIEPKLGEAIKLADIFPPSCLAA